MLRVLEIDYSTSVALQPGDEPEKRSFWGSVARQPFPTHAAICSKSADHAIIPVRCSGVNPNS